MVQVGFDTGGDLKQPSTLQGQFIFINFQKPLTGYITTLTTCRFQNVFQDFIKNLQSHEELYPLTFSEVLECVAPCCSKVQTDTQKLCSQGFLILK